MPVFPLPRVPMLTYRRTAGHRRWFGAPRADNRLHAGCDLVAPKGTPIYAATDGFVLRGQAKFFHGTFSLEVQHLGFVARYCEIERVADGIRLGARVRQGQIIGYVGRMFHDSMLHFEMYSGTTMGPLTQRHNSPFQRRADLIDPTPHLDKWIVSGVFYDQRRIQQASPAEDRRLPGIFR